ncbi:MAG: hypothetical protein ACLPJJ_06045, partial [Acidocella sp.]
RLDGRLARVLAVPAGLTGIWMSAHLAPAWLANGFLCVTRFEELPMRVDNFHFYPQFGAILLFFAVLALPAAQRVLDSRPAQLLGRYSFSLYLVHFPILFTVAMFCLVRLHAAGLGVAIGVASVCGLTVTFAAMLVFERLVDRSAIFLSRKLRIFERNRPLSMPARVL